MPTLPVLVPPGPNTNLDKYDSAAGDATILSRVLAKVQYVEDCWLWGGALNDRGYAVIQVEHSTIYVHRLTYRIIRGALLPGMVLDHLCRNTTCVNPMHTEQVSSAENTRRGATNGNKQSCPKGHEYSDLNTRQHTDTAGRTRRYCITCTNDRNKAWRQSHPSANLQKVAVAETLQAVQ